jgi:hypothetical protein
MKAIDIIKLLEGMEGVSIVSAPSPSGSVGDLGEMPMNPLKLVAGHPAHDELKKSAKRIVHRGDGTALLYDGDGVVVGYVKDNEAEELNLPRSGETGNM